PPPSPPLFPYTTLFRSEYALEARHQFASLVARDKRWLVAPAQADEHRVVIVHWDPGAVVQMRGELSLRRLRPERQHEIGEAPIGDRKSTRLNSSHLGNS